MNQKNFLIDNDFLMKEWNYEKNSDIDPTKTSYGSTKKAWWKCKYGHIWIARVSDRFKGNGCPYCSNRKVLQGFNDLTTTDPELIKEWNYKKNATIRPENVTRGSAKEIWWLCSKCNGEWKTKLYVRTKSKHGCPYCSNQKILPGYNDFETKYPEIAKEWNYEKNIDLRPNQVMSTITRKVWWIGKCGHEWEAKLRDRVSGDNCPYCAGHRVLKGFNDLASQNSSLAKEWNYEKNGDLGPDQVTKSSGKKVWWKCNKGHEWIATIASRNCGNGCKKCATEMQTSLPEKIIFFYIRKKFKDAIENYKPKWLKPMELDIFIPSKKIGIEYDGRRWHKNIEKDNKKNDICNEHGITLIRIREKGCKKLNGKSKDFYVDNIKASGMHVLPALDWIGNLLNITINSNIKRDVKEINNLMSHNEKEKSLQETYPTLAMEWNYAKNGNLKPSHVSKSSGKKVWWKCKYGHEWFVSINDRIHNNNIRKCPYCMNQKVWSGFNDLETKYPKIAKEWNYEKNGNLRPSQVLPGSQKKVWWKGKCGHEWKATISSRRNTGCSICDGKIVLPGYNDLETLCPEIAKEWNYEKNGNLKPNQVAKFTNKEIWWKCKYGHEWKTKISTRAQGGNCPYCTNRIVLKGFNDLATKYPTIVKQWDYQKNIEQNPDNILPSSKKVVSWKCDKCGFEYKKAIYNKVRSPRCPKCKK